MNNSHARWDKSAALNRLNNKEDLFKRLSQMYLSSAPKQLAIIQNAWAQQQWSIIKHTAHNLKGMSATLGAIQVVELTKQLESLPTTTKQQEIIQTLDQALDEFISLLKHYLSQ